MTVEHASREYKLPNPELESFLPAHRKPTATACRSKPKFGHGSLLNAFVDGALACFLTQYAICGSSCFFHPKNDNAPSIAAPDVFVLASPWAGVTERYNYPPPTPTNAFPSMFPTDVGYAGKTPTGAEPAVIATAPSYPVHTGAPVLVTPNMFSRKKGKKFDLLTKWGNLSPYSMEPGLHLLHRGTASYGGPAGLSSRLNSANSKRAASGKLNFLNEWTYKLGEITRRMQVIILTQLEVLTPFGRQQLFDLGTSMRLKYGFLLKNFTESNTLPVFRTESQARMLASAQNFAIGFFGYPVEGQYQQSITIEGHGFNNTLAPYTTYLPNAQDSTTADRGRGYLAKWASIYLKKALRRLQPQLTGYNLTIEDVYVFQQLCAYETVALGYSKFCELFTEEEWDGFEYSFDLYFWYNSGFGFPLARSQGIGYVQELVAWLTHTPILTHNSSTNATLDDNPITFPFGQSLYDAEPDQFHQLRSPAFEYFKISTYALPLMKMLGFLVTPLDLHGQFYSLLSKLGT
ncbi:histidine phosphatase superfamily [Mycena rebaudengoi]|nr:histidine phosphatase superfamily [Mycena rebaudengoi]KAJ7274732.1 histidine phosphatase superfamily [Mycena rebaudengoi]